MPKGDSTKRENFTKRATGNSAHDIGRIAEINTTTNLLANLCAMYRVQQFFQQCTKLRCCEWLLQYRYFFVPRLDEIVVAGHEGERHAPPQQMIRGRRALSENSKSDSTHFNCSLVLATLNQPAEAAEQFTKSLALNPSAEALNSRGTVYNLRGRYREAITDFDTARYVQLKLGSVGPGVAALEGKIVRVRHDPPFRRHTCGHLIGYASALAIGNGLLLAVEAQAQLLAHVPGRSPTHQRLDLTGRLRLKVEHPVLGIGLARLHGGLGWLVDARGHG